MLNAAFTDSDELSSEFLIIEFEFEFEFVTK